MKGAFFTNIQGKVLEVQGNVDKEEALCGAAVKNG